VVAALVSGKTEAALRAQAERLHAHLEVHTELALEDVAYSLALTRTPFERRAVVVATERGALLEGLLALKEGKSAPTCAVARPGPTASLRCC
jgi:acyl transferase domain-containing protein